jgi:hypothetical protein
MKTTFISLIALGIAAAMAGPADRAHAGEPMVLTDAQMDTVTAGGVVHWNVFPGEGRDEGRIKYLEVSPPVADSSVRNRLTMHLEVSPPEAAGKKGNVEYEWKVEEGES